jgi:hypothetical protein
VGIKTPQRLSFELGLVELTLCQAAKERQKGEKV